MSNSHPDRMNDAQLDADISVLGDDSQGEPKLPRLGDAPTPTSKEGLNQAVDGTGERGSTAVPADQQRVSREAVRDVVDGYGKG
ncbi:hypothetical protein [Aureimonas jatrophae]|uniref:Uncharacterized protein n=1 Tax=Aureimonas jatrophae TaxID=1166073 RepID=A0A1H0JHA5_9HYPH|nr:hypothetical protein [Aureimonas jatrophae]MBB3951414.1 hypothetical protein [Aureimonas jatrophae]SDO43024.1 hypothetical protein SAMN05192530_106181 [Aureimonas jatrophae]